MKEKLVKILTNLGVTRVGSWDDPCRWSPTDLATDIAYELECESISEQIKYNCEGDFDCILSVLGPAKLDKTKKLKLVDCLLQEFKQRCEKAL